MPGAMHAGSVCPIAVASPFAYHYRSATWLGGAVGGSGADCAYSSSSEIGRVVCGRDGGICSHCLCAICWSRGGRTQHEPVWVQRLARPVQDSFVLDACVDGNSIVVSNNHSFPVAVFRSPADNNTGADLQGVGAAQPVLLSQTTYAKATRSAYLVSKASGDLLLPGDILRYPIGPGKAEIDVSQVSDYMNAFYALASVLSSVTRYNYADSLSAWAQALVQGKLEYNHCLAAKNASVVRCTAVATWVITKNALLLLGNLALRGLPNVLSAFAGFVQGLTVETFVFDQSTAYLIQDPLLAITTKSLSDGSVGSSYSQTVQATGGTTPYSWSISSGSLPPGLSINRTTGEISGTPSAAGYFSFEVTVTDSSTGANPGTAKSFDRNPRPSCCARIARPAPRTSPVVGRRPLARPGHDLIKSSWCGCPTSPGGWHTS